MGTGTPLRAAPGVGPVGHEPDADGALLEVARAAVAAAPGRGGDGGWRADVEDSRCTLRPPARQDPAGGRAAGPRLHVVAPAGAAAAVLAAVAGTVAADACPFRFAVPGPDAGGARTETGGHRPTGLRVTVLPADGAQGRRLTVALRRAVAALPGTTVLVEPPAVAGPPVDLPEGRGSTGGLLGSRYALPPQSPDAPGGLLVGTDTLTGEPVAVRRAALGDDARARAEREALRREARVFARLGRAGLAPRPVGLIGRQDALHLVRAYVPGRSLEGWTAERLRSDGDVGVPWTAALPVALSLLDLVDGARAEELPLTGLTAAGVVVRPDGAVRLTATAACAEPGTLSAARARHGADAHALGGLLFLLATGRPPLLADDFPEARAGTPAPVPATARLARWLAAAARHGEGARRLAPVVLGLLAADPAERWTAARARAALLTGR